MPADTPSATADTPSTARRPDDLVPMAEAARLVDRSVSTVRAWLRSGKLTKHREEPGNASSRAMVSRAELMAYAAVQLDPAPARPPGGARPEPPASVAPAPADDLGLRAENLGLRVELARLRAELDGTRAVLEATRAHVATLEASAATVGDLVASARAEGRELARVAEEHARDLRADLDRMREERDAARAEAAALKTYAGLPWWRRMVTGPTAALEVDES